MGNSVRSMTRPEAAFGVEDGAAPEVGEGVAFPMAGASSSGRGIRLSKAVPARVVVALGGVPRSGAATADLEPCSETPRKLILLPAGAAGRPVALPRGGDVAAEGVPRRSGVFDVKPGGGVVVAGEGEAIPGGGVNGPG